MKIVDYETFIRMPAGTIFAPYTPNVFLERFEVKVDGGEEYINYKGEKVWGYNGTMPLEPWLGETFLFDEFGCEKEASFEVYDGDSNDASEYKYFCVLSKEDVYKLIHVLQWACTGCTGQFEEFHEMMEDFVNQLKKEAANKNDSI